MSEEKQDKDSIYMICPFCRSTSYTMWTDRKLSEWTKHHIERQRCRT